MSEPQQLPQNVLPHLVGDFFAWFAAQGLQTQSGIGKYSSATLCLQCLRFPLTYKFWRLSQVQSPRSRRCRERRETDTPKEVDSSVFGKVKDV